MARDFSVMQDNIATDIQDTTDAMKTIIGRYLNRRYKEVLKRLNLNYINEDYSISVSAGTQDYELPTDFKSALYAYDSTNNIPLSRTTLQELVGEEYDNLEDTNSVRKYTIFNSDDGKKYVRFHNIPVASITVLFPYIVTPADMSADTDEPVLDIDDLIEIGATGDALRYKKQYAKANVFDNKFERLLLDYMFAQENDADQIHQMKPRVFNRNNLI